MKTTSKQKESTYKPSPISKDCASRLIDSMKSIWPAMLLMILSSFAVQARETEADLLELPLDQLVNVEVESASRFKQKASEAPSAVEVVTADDIRKFGWRDFADALNAMRGLYIRNDRTYSYLGVRGFNRLGDFGSRVLIMIDGRRLNEGIFDQVSIAEEFMLDMNLIERIEYIPGSGSSIYGANALLGVINVITKQGKDFNNTRLSGEIGSYDTYRGRLTFGKQYENGADLLLNVSQYYSGGNENLYFPEYADVNGGIAHEMDNERTKRIFGQFSYRDLTLRAGFVDRYKRIPTASYGAIFNDNDYYNDDMQAYLDADYTTQITHDLGLEARAFHHWYSYTAWEPFDANESVPPVARVINYDAADARWWGGEFKLIGTQFANHKWIAGLDLQHDQHQHQKNYDVNPFFLYQDSTLSGWRVGLYAQDEYRITDNILLNFGLRLDYHHLIKTLQLHPRAGLIWDVTPSLTAKLLYGSAFRAPNAYERDFDIAAFGFKRNPDNSEENIENYEAVLEWYADKGLKFLGTLFYNDLQDLLVQDTNSLMFVNSGAFQMYGFELGAEKRWDNGRMFKLTWTHNYNRDETLDGGGWAQDSPKNLVKVHYAEPLWKDKLSLGFEEIFVDERRTLGNNIVPSYHLFNINLALTQPVYGFQASLGIYNVLDQHYRMVIGSEHVQDSLAMDGRTARFRLEYGF